MVEKLRGCKELKVGDETPQDASSGPLEDFQSAEGTEFVVLITKERKLASANTLNPISRALLEDLAQELSAFVASGLRAINSKGTALCLSVVSIHVE